MGCPDVVILDEYLTFSVAVHNPETGGLQDASPTYRIYDDVTKLLILSGNMTKLGDVSTTGFYIENFICTAAQGFEDGKGYTICIEGPTLEVTGGITFSFRCFEKIVDGLGLPIIIQGYDALAGRQVQIVGKYK
jgi:hypothetical protein